MIQVAVRGFTDFLAVCAMLLSLVKWGFNALHDGKKMWDEFGSIELELVR